MKTYDGHLNPVGLVRWHQVQDTTVFNIDILKNEIKINDEVLEVVEYPDGWDYYDTKKMTIYQCMDKEMFKVFVKFIHCYDGKKYLIIKRGKDYEKYQVK